MRRIERAFQSSGSTRPWKYNEPSREIEGGDYRDLARQQEKIHPQACEVLDMQDCNIGASNLLFAIFYEVLLYTSDAYVFFFEYITATKQTIIVE